MAGINDAAAGADNLLRNAVGVKIGQSLLIVTEPADLGHYRDNIGNFVAEKAREIGAEVEVLEVPLPSGPETFPDIVKERLSRMDHTIFFSRIGDQVRFLTLPGSGTKTMVYAIDRDFLASDFGHLPFGLLEEIRDLVIDHISRASLYTITSPLGTNLAMELPNPLPGTSPVMPFSLKNFPVMIFPPVTGAALEGRLVVSHALTSTYIHDYDNSVLPLTAPVSFEIKGGRVVEIEAEGELGNQVRAQFERVSSIVGGDPWAVNSWHTGINPTTYFPKPALSEIDRWASVAFGSPRYTHFHLCGHAPGDICGQVFDATITFDDEPLWDQGRFVFLERPEAQATLDRYGVRPDALLVPRPLGV